MTTESNTESNTENTVAVAAFSEAVYGNRKGPSTWNEFAPILVALLKSKAVVSISDMQKALSRKWVHGVMKSVSETVEPILPVRAGRKTIGYRFASKPVVKSKSGAVRGPNGRFVKATA